MDVNLRSIPKFSIKIALKVWRCPIELKNFGFFIQTLAEADAEDGAFSSLELSVGIERWKDSS
jgi:hypothetical protein